MAIKLGIVGGIGSGKSVVSQLLRVMGVPVYDSDTEAKRLNNEDPFIRQQLTELVGREVYLPSGELNKPLLANYLFASAEHAKAVNAIIHPRVCTDFAHWATERANLPCVAVECALLMESGLHKEVDKILLVSAPFASRVAWAMKRDGATEEAIARRIRQQMSDEALREVADYVVVNDGERPLIPQVDELLSKITKTD